MLMSDHQDPAGATGATTVPDAGTGGMFEFERRMLSALAEVDRATLEAPLGTGGSRLASLALAVRARAAGVGRVYVAAPAPLRAFLCTQLREVGDVDAVTDPRRCPAPGDDEPVFLLVVDLTDAQATALLPELGPPAVRYRVTAPADGRTLRVTAA